MLTDGRKRLLPYNAFLKTPTFAPLDSGSTLGHSIKIVLLEDPYRHALFDVQTHQLFFDGEEREGQCRCEVASELN